MAEYQIPELSAERGRYAAIAYYRWKDNKVKRDSAPDDGIAEIYDACMVVAEQIFCDILERAEGNLEKSIEASDNMVANAKKCDDLCTHGPITVTMKMLDSGSFCPEK